MKFKVEFYGVQSTEIVSVNEQDVSLSVLDSFGLKAKDVENSQIHSLYKRSITLDLDEETARTTNLFDDTSEIKVYCNRRYFNNCVDVVVADKKVGNMKEIKYVINHEKIFDKWKANGYKKQLFTDEYIQEQKEKEEKAKLEKEVLELRKKEREQREELEKQEMKQWIKSHGSEYLKDCLELGYKAKRAYIEERASYEFPEYTYMIDFKDDVEVWERINPTHQGIEDLKEFKKQYDYPCELKYVSDEYWLNGDVLIESDTEVLEVEFLGKYIYIY